jgi:protein-tyrosine-phosphatase
MMGEKDKDIVGLVEVASAGFVPQALKDIVAQFNVGFPEPFFNRPIAEMTRRILHQKDITVPSEWRTKELTPGMVEEANLIITALPIQKRELLMLFPKAEGKIFSLREMAAWDKHLVLEDFVEPPKDGDYWHYLEENPEYVTKILSETEDLLMHGYPRIIERLRHDRSAI